jgi:hypothetical protein
MYGNNDIVISIADNLDWMSRPCGAARLIAKIPELWRHEDKQENQRDHHVVMHVAPRIRPIEIALQKFVHRPTETACTKGFLLGKSRFISLLP